MYGRCQRYASFSQFDVCTSHSFNYQVFEGQMLELLKVICEEYTNNKKLEDIARDIGTKEVVITPTESVSVEDLTPRPSGADFQSLTPADIAPGDAAAQQAANEAAEQIIESGGIPQSVEDVVDDYWAQFGY